MLAFVESSSSTLSSTMHSLDSGSREKGLLHSGLSLRVSVDNYQNLRRTITSVAKISSFYVENSVHEKSPFDTIFSINNGT